MGILDKKTRFIDLVITQEGKRQMSAGKLKATFASLSDGSSFYKLSEKGDVNNRLYFEVMERPENSITLETDDSGRLLEFDFSPTGSIVGNNIFLNDATVQNVLAMKAVTGSQFSSIENDILSSSLKHFKNNYFIGSYDKKGFNEFELSRSEITFTISNDQPFSSGPYKEKINVNNAEPFFMDPKLTHLDNFKFLPPKNMDGSNYGEYEDIRSLSRETWEDIKANINTDAYAIKEVSIENSSNLLTQDSSGRLGRESRKLLEIGGALPVYQTPKRESNFIKFNKTSSENNVLIQIFENQSDSNSLMTKLDIIDAGVYIDSNDINARFKKHVFYAGKIFYDDFGSKTFINIFTMIMD